MEVAADDGSLEKVEGIGNRRAQMIRAALTERLGRPRVGYLLSAGRRPSVTLLLDVDREYRERAESERFARSHPSASIPLGKLGCRFFIRVAMNGNSLRSFPIPRSPTNSGEPRIGSSSTIAPTGCPRDNALSSLNFADRSQGGGSSADTKRNASKHSWPLDDRPLEGVGEAQHRDDSNHTITLMLCGDVMTGRRDRPGSAAPERTRPVRRLGEVGHRLCRLGRTKERRDR